jgi:hypothetical protein
LVFRAEFSSYLLAFLSHVQSCLTTTVSSRPVAVRRVNPASPRFYLQLVEYSYRSVVRSGHLTLTCQLRISILDHASFRQEGPRVQINKPSPTGAKPKFTRLVARKPVFRPAVFSFVFYVRADRFCAGTFSYFLAAFTST